MVSGVILARALAAEQYGSASLPGSQKLNNLAALLLDVVPDA